MRLYIVCHADDATLSAYSKDPAVLKTKLDEHYELIAKYMAMNKLKLNSEKTHLMIMRTAEKHKRTEHRHRNHSTFKV